jgi:hypothetical protein
MGIKSEKEVDKSISARSEEIWEKRPSTIDIIKPETYKQLSREASVKGTSLRKLCNEVLEMYLEKEEFLEKYIPKLKKLAFEDNIFFVRDSKINKTAEISYNDGLIHCSVCKKSLCFHTLYAMSQPDIARLEPTQRKTK